MFVGLWSGLLRHGATLITFVGSNTVGPASVTSVVTFAKGSVMDEPLPAVPENACLFFLLIE